MLGGSAPRYWRRQQFSGVATQTKPSQSQADSSKAARPPSRVDLERFRADLSEAGVEEMLGDLLATFAEDAPIRFAALKQAARDRDPKAIERAAHAFKSGAGTIRATQSRPAARRKLKVSRPLNIARSQYARRIS